MDRKEAKAKRKELGLLERRLTEKHCANCSVKGQDVTACEGCPIFNKITCIGKKYIAVTQKYRRVNKIKGIDDSLIAPVEPKIVTATALAWMEWKQVAKEHGISRETFSARVKTGMNPKVAATRATRKRHFTDEQIATALKNGIPYGTLITRIKRGWSLEDSITVPVHQKSSKRGSC